MKLDSESPYQHTRPLQENETKLIVHCDNAFIIAKDNHFIINLLNMDKESPKEGKLDHKSHFERKSSEVTCPPKQHLSVEDTLNINKSDHECVNPLYSAPASGFEMVVKDDLYTHHIVTKAEFPEVRVCIEDDPCQIVRDISIDEGLHFSHKSLVEKEEGRPIEYSISNKTLENGSSDKVVGNEQMDPIKSSISNKTISNGHDDSKNVMTRSVGSDDSNHIVFDCSISNVKMGQSEPASVLHNASDGKGSFVVTENLLDPATVIYDEYDGKDSQARSINSEDDLETTNSVVCSTTAKVIENQAVSGSDFPNDCDSKGPYVSSIDGQNKLGSYESVVTNAHGKGYSLSSINSEGNLNTTTSEFSNISVGATKNRAVSVSDDHKFFDGDGSHVSSDKVNTDESILCNISRKVSSVSSINSENCVDTISVVTNISAEVVENQAVPVSSVHNDCEGRESYSSSVDSQNKQDTYKSVISNLSVEVVEDQLLPSLEITADSSNMNSSGQTCSNGEKQSVDGQEFLTISEETNLARPALNFPSEVPALSNGSKESSLSCKTISEETNLARPALNFPSEVPALSNGSKESSLSCKVPSGVITFSFDTEEASTSGRDENVETMNSQKSEVAQNSLGIDDTSASIRCSSLRFIQEESNLYGPALLSGHNLNPGNLLYSGSVSIRSESSTASTRSFAFPILQSEWNSSPVKMAKADRRRKHRGWKMGLTCCRF